jgi:2,4-dienoyl-CoA reductase-like NADH-dependent reductase (Old Yellow Enzyme family)
MGAFEEEEETFLRLASELGRRGIAYLHVMDQASRGAPAMPTGFLQKLRAAFPGPLIVAGGLTLGSANQLITSGVIDLAAFGVPFIANPDLVERFRHGWPVTGPDREAFYGGGLAAYTDYPFYGAERLIAA